MKDDEKLVREALENGGDLAFERDVTHERVQLLLSEIDALRKENERLKAVIADAAWL